MCIRDRSLTPGLCPRTLVAQCPGLLLPKLRRQFAEFLQRRSLKRLGMLNQSTCVGLGYGLMVELFPCLLYTSDAADDLLCVDLGGRRIIKKKKKKKNKTYNY
eukprot:TRINITY_DN98_c0_g1_i21.p1 TRINITY_DN98_c0_g1~~TRINITY_DN98_c0_g1_i21.p1  ORF type:complete len:103 (+),score=45.63 TRINITY_DN98_c0_g1_i21:184-492(+)